MAYGFMSSIMMDGLRASLQDDAALAAAPPVQKGTFSEPSTRQVSDDCSATDLPSTWEGDATSAGQAVGE
eukprot:CAMPEP_0176252446 /NCGR_PEP_ID=MMETSP0121_2-20121125/35511_1 /TAXON_ID=160619 /ORGANISM="Kryptoperidinium foliaceum, Strain CCMP 1326" /LENGTH=69 /DNA_ID=CAMNT_0017592205 /DNA_START=4 /DNA_END=213 /DNA_ORIENTATION=+